MESNLRRLGGCLNDKTVCVSPKISLIDSLGLCFSFWLIDLIIFGILGVTCESKNVIYFLKCTRYNYSTTYIGKTVDLRSRMNNHITSCRLGRSTDKFDNHVFYCMQNQKQKPFFQILTVIKLADEQNLPFYEKLLQNRGYDTLNTP